MFSNNPTLSIELLGIVLVFFGLLAAAGIMLVGELSRNSRLEKRLGVITAGGETMQQEEAKPEGSLPLRIVSGFGMFIARSGLLSRKTLAEITATLEAIGFRGGRGLGLFIGAKILLMLISPIIGLFIAEHLHLSRFWTFACVAGGFIFGMLAPESYATNVRTKHLEKVEIGVPDALDMLVICADAGLALEAGIARVAQEIQSLNPALGMELMQTSRELQIGADMRQVMESLGQRTGLEVLQRLATTLAQSLQYGTPLTQALRTLSTELRDEALIKFEEKAGKLPTMMTMPMIIFILPCVFLIVAGPAIINVMATFQGHK